MLVKTRALVLKSVKYADSALVVKAYTEQSGLRSWLVRGVYRKGSQMGAAMFHGMNLLEVVYSEKSEGRGLAVLREASVLHPLTTVPFDVLKSTLAQFINELIYKSVKEEEPNPGLFAFLSDTLLLLDNTVAGISGFHLGFMLDFAKHLGFFPLGTYSDRTPFFLLREGVFSPTAGMDNDFLAGEAASDLSDMAMLGVSGSPRFEASARRRQKLLENLLLYYRIHLPGMGEMQSHEILKQVFHQ